MGRDMVGMIALAAISVATLGAAGMHVYAKATQQLRTGFVAFGKYSLG